MHLTKKSPFSLRNQLLFDRNNILKALVFSIILILGAIGVSNSLKYYELKSPNSGGQHFIISAAEGYLENGFLQNAGLPDINFGNQNPNEPSSYIYTHYPPGPMWLAGVSMKICGVGKFKCMRLLPTVISTISLFVFAWLLLSSLTPARSLVTMLAVAVIPLTSNAMHAFHYHPYSQSLLFIQLGLLLNIFKKKKRITIINFILLFLLGFLQGWLSFDFFFVVSFAALPFALLYAPLEQKEDKKRLILAVLASYFGFCFAHFLHFMQVVVYYGSFSGAFNDLIGIALARFNASAGGYYVDMYGNNAAIVSSATIIDRIILIMKYLFVYPLENTAFLIFFPLLLGSTILLTWIKDAKITIQSMHRPISIVLNWTLSKRVLNALAAALAVSFLWIIVMYNHALNHVFFIVRHLLLLYFISIIAMMECVTIDEH